jgi:hypothetical protein
MGMTDCIYLDSQYTDRIWWYYLENNVSDAMTRGLLRDCWKYGKYSTISPVSIQFENWLWQHGASLRRHNKKYVLEFTDSASATVFVLKYSL